MRNYELVMRIMRTFRIIRIPVRIIRIPFRIIRIIRIQFVNLYHSFIYFIIFSALFSQVYF